MVATLAYALAHTGRERNIEHTGRRWRGRSAGRRQRSGGGRSGRRRRRRGGGRNVGSAITPLAVQPATLMPAPCCASEARSWLRMAATVNAAIEPSWVVATFAVPGSHAVSVGRDGVVLHTGRARRPGGRPLLERVADRAGGSASVRPAKARADAGRVATLERHHRVAGPTVGDRRARRPDPTSPPASGRARTNRTRRACPGPARRPPTSAWRPCASLLSSTSVDGVRNAESALGGWRNRPSIAFLPSVACATSSIGGPSVYGLWNNTLSESGTPFARVSASACSAPEL